MSEPTCPPRTVPDEGERCLTAAEAKAMSEPKPIWILEVTESD